VWTTLVCVLVYSSFMSFSRLDAVKRRLGSPRGACLAAGLLSLLLCLALLAPQRAPPAAALAAPPALPLASVCSHQGRLSAAAQHGPATAAELLPALDALLARGVTCFDLDLSPLPGGGSAVAHPAALAAAAAAPAAGGAAAGASWAQLVAFLARAPAARVTLELKAPLGSNAQLVGALAEAARAAGVLPRLALLGLPPSGGGAPLAPGLQQALGIRDDQDCSLAALTAAVAVAMPSKACWARPAVRAALLAWAAAQGPPSAERALAGEIHVWVVDARALAEELLATAPPPPARLRLVSNDVPALLGRA
jgi:hypothetical protein